MEKSVRKGWRGKRGSVKSFKINKRTENIKRKIKNQTN